MQKSYDKNIELTFSFKGSRSYIQGPDLFDAMYAQLPTYFNLEKISNINFSVHKLVSSNIDVQIYKESPGNDPRVPCVTLAFTFDGVRNFMNGYENFKEVTTRVEFNESELLTSSNIDTEKKQCAAIYTGTRSRMELLVALNKALLQKLFPDLLGKWLFVKAQFEKHPPLNVPEEIQISLVHNLGFKLTKSSVFLSGKQVGFIFFSLQRY